MVSATQIVYNTDVETADSTDIVKAAREGHSGAFERLFREHHARVYGLALRMLGEPETAEDVTSEAFARAWQKLAHLRDERAFAGWIRRIAMNLIWDRIRSRPPVEEMQEQTAERLRDPEATPPEQLLQTRRERAIREAVLVLPAHQRDVIAMFYWEDLPVEEIGVRLGLPKGTVISRLARGRDALRRKLHGLMVQEEVREA